MVGRDTISPLAPALGPSPKIAGLVILFRCSVRSIWCQISYVTFVADAIWAVFLYPGCIVH